MIYRLFLRLYGIRISKDGRRVTIPRKRRDMLEGVITNIDATAWRNNKPAAIASDGDGVIVDGPKGRVEVRIV